MSNRTYTPDRWQPVKLTYKGEVHFKILGTWYGGYLNGDSWRFSSGVVGIEEYDDGYKITNDSGSVYMCYKGSEGMGGYTSGIYASFEKDAEKSNGDIQIELVEINELISKFSNVSQNT